MDLYGIYGSHTTEACPLFNKDNRKLLVDCRPAKPGALVVSRSKRLDVTVCAVDLSHLTVAALIQRQLVQPPILSLLLLECRWRR